MEIRHSEPIGCLAKPIEEGQREAARKPLKGLRCSHGTVIDLSRDGMKLLSERAPSTTMRLTIDLHAFDQTLTVKGRVVWTNRLDRFKVEYGVAFEDMKPGAMRTLDRILLAYEDRDRSANFRRAG